MNELTASPSGTLPVERLTPRQREVLLALGRCTPRKQIAEQMGITEATLDRHIQDLYERLEVHCVSEVVRIAVTVGRAGIPQGD